ncbi:MAG: VOC family protein [Arenicella sp.]
MKLRYTILYVEDVPKTLAFYEQAFGLKTAMLHESNDYGELSTGETKLAFSSISLMNQLGKSAQKAHAKRPVFEIAFETNHVEKALKKAMNAGALLEQNMTDMPWGQTVSYVSDFNGFLIEICSPIKNTL